MEALNQDLQRELDRLREGLMAQATPEVAAVIEEATEQLVRSGILAGVLKEGDPAPDFVLPNAVGREVRLYDQLARGPAVVTYYRGGW